MALFILFRGTLQFFDLSRYLGSALCIFGHAKEGAKPISHAVLPFSPKRNGESLNKFYTMWNKK